MNLSPDVDFHFTVRNMSLLRTVVFCVLVGSSWCAEDLSFPPGFKFGAASAAYQIEGAWNSTGKGESIWDRFVHAKPETIADLSNGDVACDSYRLWKRDVEIASEMGLHFYRFSLSWGRLLPTGFANQVSEEGALYYSNLIDELLKHGIEPVVTIYHWDLPQRFQDLGGWTNPLVADWFADYARVVYSLYSDRVKTWITINEPIIICEATYVMGIHPPGVEDPDVGTFICNKNVLLAHAKAWRIYDKEFRDKNQGQISLGNHLIWLEAKTAEDEEIAELARQYQYGRYAHPIYSKEGGWPQAIEEAIAENSKKQGYPFSRLPPFTREEVDLIRGTYDYFAFNHYTSRQVRKGAPGENLGPSPLLGVPELGAALETPDDWPIGAALIFNIYPEGIRKQMQWLRNEYGDLPFLITENGYSTKADFGLEDDARIKFYQDYLRQVLLAIKEDNINVVGYTVWSLMDNFEWTDGYLSRFGLYEVDFSDPERTRTPKKSARFYADVIKKNSLDVSDSTGRKGTDNNDEV